MQQWQSPLVNLAQTQKWRLHVVTHGSCPAALFRSGETSGSLASGCEEWRTDQLLKIKSLHPSVVIVSSQNRRGLSQSVDVAAWSRTFSALRATGAKIIYLQDTVTPPSDVPSCVAAHLEDWKHCAFKVRSSGQPNYVAWEKHSVAVPGVSVVNMLRYLCPDGVCPAVSNGVLLYRDDSHISDTAARILQGALARQLVPLVDEARSTPAKPS